MTHHAVTLKISDALYRSVLIAALALLLAAAAEHNTQAQPQQQLQQPEARAAELPVIVEPFAAIAREAQAGDTVAVDFNRTQLDTEAVGTAQVVIRGRTLLARVVARNMPLPSRFQVPRYALWVYVPNYQVKMYIGDLPIITASGANGDTVRGDSDSAYRFTALPPDAIFGGLILTAEPVRYEPLVTEALRPVLVALVPGVDPNNVGPALTIYRGPMPPRVTRQPDSTGSGDILRR